MRSLFLLSLASCAALPAPSPETVRYLRVTPQRRVLECTFTIDRSAEGWSLRSLTGNLTLLARYDPSNRLLEARAGLAGGPEKADVDERPGVIVTSAPDWTDTFRICREWDRARGGRQEFPGLWIHPAQPTQRLTFSAEFVRRDGDLDVIGIRLRNHSPYRAWVDAAGRMIKLVSLPVKPGATVLVLEGFDAAWEALPPE